MKINPLHVRGCDDTGHAAPPEGPMEPEIRAECGRIADMLAEKNRRYGNSALAPLRIFSQASTVEQLLVRIDDKLSRIRTMGCKDIAPDEDTVSDLMGYLVLLKIALRRKT